jgi:hypothetical protein
MISFMVLSAPRSASTWAANWLTTAKHLCLHDPVLDESIEHLDHLPYSRPYGLACTALPLLPDWVNAHDCPKVILHRDLGQVNGSLERIGLCALSGAWDHALERLSGWHVDYRDLFRPGCAQAIWRHLVGEDSPFDACRHALLAKMHIDPHFARVRVNPHRAREFRRQIEQALA